MINGQLFEVRCRETGLFYIGATSGSIEPKLSIRVENVATLGKILEKNNFEVKTLQLFVCDTEGGIQERKDAWLKQMNDPKCVNISVLKRKSFRDKYWRYRKEIICECGRTIVNHCLSKHLKTKSHINIIANKKRIKETEETK